MKENPLIIVLFAAALVIWVAYDVKQQLQISQQAGEIKTIQLENKVLNEKFKTISDCLKRNETEIENITLVCVFAEKNK